MGIVDTHLHLVDQSRLAYPWLAGAPALNRDWAYEAYADEAARLGITDVLHMEVDVAEADMERETEVIAALAARPGSLLRGAIAGCRPENADFPAFLERAGSQSIVKGFRRALHVMPDTLPDEPLFRENVARLSGTGLSFDLVVLPHQIGKAAALVDAVPADIPFILDHCGVPAVADRALHPWAEAISDIARRPNVSVKISGVVAYGGPSWQVEDLRPFVEHAIGAFGWDRVVWGSDWPVCNLTADLTRWVAATHALLSGCSESERAALLSENARRLYRIA